jgi:hypothetical protein
MSAPDHRTDPGFAGWGWDDIVEKVEAEIARRAQAAGQAAAAALWQDRVQRAAELANMTIEGICQGGVYPTLMLEELPGFVAACVAAVSKEDQDAEIAAWQDGPGREAA